MYLKLQPHKQLPQHKLLQHSKVILQVILDQLGYATPALLSELMTIILNANRYKSSRLGVRKTLATKETVSRNIID